MMDWGERHGIERGDGGGLDLWLVKSVKQQ